MVKSEITVPMPRVGATAWRGRAWLVLALVAALLALAAVEVARVASPAGPNGVAFHHDYALRHMADARPPSSLDSTRSDYALRHGPAAAGTLPTAGGERRVDYALRHPSVGAGSGFVRSEDYGLRHLEP
jgi:hypothetical protein